MQQGRKLLLFISVFISTGTQASTVWELATPYTPAIIEERTTIIGGDCAGLTADGCLNDVSARFDSYKESYTDDTHQIVDKTCYVIEYTSSQTFICTGTKQTRSLGESGYSAWTNAGNKGSYTSVSDSAWDTEEVETCPSDENGMSTVSYTNESDVKYCYDPTELSDVDTCPDSYNDANGIIPNASGSTTSDICVQMNDGSLSECAYSLSSDGSYYLPTFENLECYSIQDGNTVDTSVDTSKQCSELSTGVSMCIESESEMCSGGVCQEGCGTVGLADGTEYFICIGDDTDGDTIPDYSDTDIDGDGIVNEDDDDVDGDGITNNADSDYNSSTVTNTYTTVNVDNSEVVSGLAQVEDSLTAIQQQIEDIGEITPVDESEQGSYASQEEVEADIAEAQAELQELIDDIRAQAAEIFAMPTVTGSLSACYDVASFNGNTYGFCLDDYADELQIVSYAILFIFGLISIIIIFR
jgi:hypothetical protein